ncbi:alpha/beta hydrolase, partial [Myxosarcina sp. GI1]
MISQSLKVNLVLFITCIFVAISNHQVIAAEKITFGYGIATQSVSFEELATFAETGELSPALKFLFKYGKQNPQT